MRPVLLAAFTASVAFAATTALPAPDPDWKPHMGGLPFVVGLDRGREESRFMGLPQMLVFTSSTDADCPLFASVTWKDPEVRKGIAGWTPVLIDFDRAEADLKTKYKVEFVPTVVWLNHEEKYLYAVYGNAPLDVFRKELAKVVPHCPKPKEPGEGLKALLDAKKRLDDGEAAKDVKAQLAAVADIRKIRLGEAVQAAARAADERLTKEGLAAVDARGAAIESKTPAAKRAEAKKALEDLLALYGAEHPVGVRAKAILDQLRGRKK